MFEVEYKNEKAMDVSSDEEPYDSDLIDSDVEAELYSVIHHETDNSILSLENSYHSLNSSTILDYKEFSTISNVSFGSNQNMLNNNSIDSSDVQIIEITDKMAYNKSNENTDKNKYLNSLTNFSFKRKSDSDTIAFDGNQANKKKKINEQNSSKSIDLINLKSTETTVLNSSDTTSEEDDNDIICLGPVNDQKHFETNVSEIVVADSDSSSADSWCFKSPKINTSFPSTTKTEGISFCRRSDPWFVNPNDVRRSRRSSNRYHDSLFMTCSRCNQNGHSFKFCSFSKGIRCYVCGGNHSAFQCKSRVCAKCFGIGHDIRECRREVGFCETCQMAGHRRGACPDLWRRFQRTTDKKKKKNWRLPQDRPFFCYNCGLPGHFGALCNSSRMNTPAFPTWPFVLNYIVQIQDKVKPNANASNENPIKATQHFQTGKNKKKKMKEIHRSPLTRTPKTSQGKQNEDNCVDKELQKQETKKAKRRRRGRRKAKIRQEQQPRQN